jgi:glycosyltransferase involved in cell wall biosynthesis
MGILTDIPSPYQVELFNALARLDGWRVSVIYIRRTASDRAWETQPISHEYRLLYETSIAEHSQRMDNCDLVVFSGYRPARVGRLIKLRDRTGKPWAFWGERPGFRFSGWLGRWYRAWALRHIRFSQVPIWGIGEWAIDGYKSELGATHRYYNVPYFSDLSPYLAIERSAASSAHRCRFLFSGSFVPRKGVDLLISAFARLLSDGIDAELHLVGGGPLEPMLKEKSASFSEKVVLHGFKQWNELSSVYAQADVLCAPSRYDGWGLVVVEGLAAAMPVISTDRTGAARELVEPRNGWLIPAGDEAALISAMKAAATLNADQRGTMSTSARDTARRQSIDAGVQRFARAAEATIREWRLGARETAPLR